MLRFMRDKFKSLQWILWAVIASFVLWIFVAWGMDRGGGMGDDPTANTAAIDVDGHIVSRTDFLRQVQQTQNTYREQLGENADAFLKQINVREQVTTALISRKIAAREAERAGLLVSRDELREHILKTFVDAEGDFIGAEKLERLARRLGFGPDEFRTAVGEDILVDKFRGVVEAGLVIADDDLRAEYLRRNENATVRYVYLDDKTAPATPVTTEEAQQYYDQHKQQFEAEERKAAYVVFSASDFTSEANPSEAELRKAFDDQARFGIYDEQRRARHILVASKPTNGSPEEQRKRADELLASAQKGEDFATLATKTSDDENSAVKGGDLGFFRRGAMVKPFEDAAFEMKPGEIRGPIESSFGYHIIKLEEIRSKQDFDQIKPALVEAERGRKARTLAREAAVAALTKGAHGNDLAALAKAVGKSVQESGFLRPDTKTLTLAGIDPAYTSGVVRALYGESQAGNVLPEPISAGDSFVVLRFIEKRGPSVPPFEDIRDRVIEATTQARALDAARARLRALREAALGGNLEDAAKIANLEAKTSSPFGRSNAISGIPHSEPAARIAWELNTGGYSEVIDLEQGVILLQVKDRFEFQADKFASEKDALRRDLRASRQSDLWNALIRSVRKDLESRDRIKFVARDLFASTDAEADEVF